MPSFFLPFGISVLAVLIVELLMWRLFCKKMEGLNFPHESDGSQLRFFTLQRVRISAIVHALVEILILFFLFLWLW